MPLLLTRTYTRTYVAQLSFAVEEENLRIRTAIAAADTGELFPEPDGVSFPLEFFKDAKGELNQMLLESFCKNLADSVVPLTIDQAMFRDFAYHVVHCSHLLAVRMGISNEAYENLIPKLAQFHTDIIIARLKALTGQQTVGKGRHAKWTSDSLSAEILVAMRKIKNPTHRTYPNVAKSLHQEFPEQCTSDKASALKKLVSRYGLNWEELKQKATLTDREIIQTLPAELQRLIKTLPASTR
jgi:hypothetical protein